jgi:hypothetical protein
VITELHCPIPLLSPKGKCWAIAILDYGMEHNLHWITFDDATGECWTWSNPEIRIQPNITIGRCFEREKS